MKNRRPVLPLAAYALAIALAGGSFAFYASRFDPTDQWQASDFDPADYRLLAEYFWGATRVQPTTYTLDPEYQAFFRNVPFRGIGLGTLYLLAGVLRIGHAPSTPHEVLATGILLATVEKILLAAALFLLFEAVWRWWGPLAALVAITATALPPRFWRQTDDFLTEPVLRICFLTLFAGAIALGRKKWPALAFGMMFLVLIAAHLKADWALAGVILVPILLWSPTVAATPVRTKAALVVSAALIPLSIVAVNWIGWSALSLRPGLGFHANLKYGGDLEQRFCEQQRERSHVPPFCDEHRPHRARWKVYMGGDVTLQDVAALDAYARREIASHPGRALNDFWDGLKLASTVPGTTHRFGMSFRVVPLPLPWQTIVRWMDAAVWILLFIGLKYQETRLPSAAARLLWTIPALGNVFSLYELRYHMPMAGIAETCAFRVLTLVGRDALVRRASVAAHAS
jgi:hypothetical protein